MNLREYDEAVEWLQAFAAKRARIKSNTTGQLGRVSGINLPPDDREESFDIEWDEREDSYGVFLSWVLRESHFSLVPEKAWSLHFISFWFGGEKGYGMEILFHLEVGQCIEQKVKERFKRILRENGGSGRITEIRPAYQEEL